MKRTEKFRNRRRNRLIATMLILIAITITGVTIYIASVKYNDDSIRDSDRTFKTASPTATPGKAEKAILYENSGKPDAANVSSHEPTKVPELTPSPDCLPSKFNMSWDVIKDGKVVKDFKRDYSIVFPDAGEYSKLEGVTAFRGNNYRNSASYGTADVKEEKLEAVWSVNNGSIDEWTGVGWNGQPSIVKWDDNTKSKMNLFPEKKSKKDLKEIIYATLDGNIYFFDLDDGQATRPSINIGYPHKGSVVIDPRGYPLLYAGQGIDTKEGKTVPIGYRIFSLIDEKLLLFIDGMDHDAIRRWGAFDSGALIDSKTDTLIECGENGLVYTVKLNTNYSLETGSISINPEVTKYRYRSSISKRLGIENSPVAYKNFIYFADNNGLFQCVDLNTLQPVWARDVSDDTDSTTVLEAASNSEVSLYTACEVDHQGDGGYSYIRKINALTGDLLWEVPIKCFYDSNTNGGALASPVLGKNDISDLVIYNIAKTDEKNNGSKLMALDKKTGKVIWENNLKYYCWSSPVAVYTKEGKSYLIVCDSVGYMILYEGKSGKKLDSIPLEANIEASPAVYGNMIVVGTRGQKIWGIRIK